MSTFPHALLPDLIWTSHIGARFLFTDKKHTFLHTCIDYRGLNDIPMKKKFPLPPPVPNGHGICSITLAAIFSQTRLVQPVPLGEN